MTETVTVTCSQLDDIIWEPLSSNHLADGIIHVWRAPLHPLQFSPDDYLQELPPDEKQRAARFVQTEDRNRFLLGRKMLRSLVGYFYGTPPESVKIKTGSNGKPFLSTNEERPIFFNLSHAGHWVLLSMGLSESGVDVEAINHIDSPEDLFAACLSPEEQEALQEAPDKRQLFCTYWTRKEALLKATGIGLVDELTAIPCLNGANRVKAKLVRCNQDWDIQSFKLDEQHIASIALLPGSACRFHDFTVTSQFPS
ncbi:4'-phosphopantetheinyl transferase superfamily protein [Flavisolibacter sp. BT320]|nr:4'-phosphopantetheinyl transferase superfamily protein [Flavisolibacter longurius]